MTEKDRQKRTPGQIDRMLTLSTSHISEETYRMLQQEINHPTMEGVSVYEKRDAAGDCGLFLYLDSPSNMPDDLKSLFAHAEKHGCTVICLDADGPVIARLAVHIWRN